MTAGPLADYFQASIKGTPVLAPGDLPSTFYALKSGLTRILVTGTGSQTIVLCPDGPCGLEHDAELIALLSKRFRVVAFEPPGFGYSRPSRAYRHTLSDGVQFLDEVMEATGTKSAVFCLPCVAGQIALAYAMKRPEKVDALVSIQTPAWDDFLRWVETIDRYGFARTPVLGQLGFWALSEWIQMKWYRAAEPDRALREKIIAIHRQRNQKSCVFVFPSTLQALRGSDPFASHVIKKPAAILWGARDRTHAKTSPESLRRLLPDAKLFVVPNAGHFPELTAPETLLAAIEHVLR